MVTAIDTSVLLDLICDNNSSKAEASLRLAASQGKLIVCECVIAELRPSLTDEEITEFFRDWGIEFVPSSFESSLLAGQLYETHLKRRGSPRRVLPDFLIGAHALQFADCLLARDRGYWRDYFQGLNIVCP